MNKDITMPALIIIIGFIFVYCVLTTPSDSEVLDKCGDSEGCKYAIMPH